MGALQSQPIWYNAAVYRAAEIKLVQYQLSQGGAHQTSPVASVAPVAAVCESSAVEAKVAPKVAPVAMQTASDMVKELKQDIISTSAGAICDLSDLLARVVQLEKDNNAIKNELQTALNRLDQLGGSSAEASSSKPAAKPADDDDDEEEEEEEDEDDGHHRYQALRESVQRDPSRTIRKDQETYFSRGFGLGTEVRDYRDWFRYSEAANHDDDQRRSHFY